MLREKIIDWLFKDTELKQTQMSASAPVVYLDETNSQSSARSIRKIAQYGYIDNITVYRAINILADACASISWEVFKGRGKNKIKQDENHPLNTLLSKPNPEQAGSTFIHKLISHWMLAGTMYQFAAFPGNPTQVPRKDTSPAGLYLLHPLMVEPKTEKGELVAYRYQSGANYVDYPVWKILPLRFFHPLDELSGVSPVMVAALVIERQNEGEAWTFSLMKHAARPSSAFIAQSRLGEVAYEQLKSEVRKVWGTGKRQAGYPIVLDSGLNYVQMGLSPMDMDWGNSDSNAGRKISTAIGVDPLLLNDKEHSTYNNVREARLAMMEMTVIPLLDRIRDEWNGWLCPWYGDDISTDYDKSTIEILRGNRAIFSTMVLSEWNGGVRSFNESTEELKLGKVEEKDDFYKFGPALFIRKSDISAWLDQQVQNRQASTQGLQLANQQRLGNTNNGGNGNKNPLKLPELITKANTTFQTFKIEEVFTSHKMTDEEKRYYDEVNAERDVWAEKMSGHLETYFDEELQQMLLHIGNATTLEDIKQAVFLSLSQHAEMLPHVLVPYYLDIAESSKNRVVREANLKMAISIHTKDALSDLAHYASSHITNINETTREKINTLFLQAGENTSPYDLKKQLTEIYGGFKSSRAMMIARTEALAASNLGSQIAMRETGLPILKTWLASQDSHTRDWHANASGQQTYIDNPYYVNGEALMFPGDTSLGASAENVINCRCTETFQLYTGGELAKASFFKFNPYHDRLGRFSTGSLSSGMGLLEASNIRGLSKNAQKTIVEHLKRHGVTFEKSYTTAEGYLTRGLNSGHAEETGSWYSRAHDTASAMGKKYGVSTEQAAGVLSALSPQNPWDVKRSDGMITKPNIESALGLLRTYRNNPTVTISQGVIDGLKTPRIRDMLQPYVDKPTKFRDLPPEVAGYAVNNDFKGYPANLAKGIRILNGESPGKVLGGSKVRNFFTNIMWPGQKEGVTLDTWMGRVLSGQPNMTNDEANHMFTQPTRNGLRGIGTYPFFSDIITKVAEKYHLLPNQAQAIIWEQARVENPQKRAVFL